MNIKLLLKQHKQSGSLTYKYNPFNNIIAIDYDDDGELKEMLCPFRTTNVKVDLKNPINIECVTSYDGTVDLILNDNNNPPRIVNSRFTALENNMYKIINRNQSSQTNLYDYDKIDSQTRLFRNINKIPYFKLNNVESSGQLKGGNYIFYLKYADNDYNQTDIVAESGTISIFNGDSTDIRTISGTLLNEITNKSINLTINNIDTNFSKVYLYYIRSTSDLSFVRQTECCRLSEPYLLTGNQLDITISGYEEVNIIDKEELNVKYNVVNSARTQTQVQNMLFMGNIQEPLLDHNVLQDLSYRFVTNSLQVEDPIGNVNAIDYTYDITPEYYSPNNIYNNLGYWPNEFYRLGIVYIMNDDTLSPVYNLVGISNELNNNNYDDSESSIVKTDENGELLNTEISNDNLKSYNGYQNVKGVFKTKNYNIIDSEGVRPIYFNSKFSKKTLESLRDQNIKGFFFVRQARLPVTLAQGLSIPVDKESGLPLLHDPENQQNFTETFLTADRTIVDSDSSLSDSKIYTNISNTCSGLLCMDANIDYNLQSMLNGNTFYLSLDSTYDVTQNSDSRQFYTKPNNNSLLVNTQESNLLFVPGDIPSKYLNGNKFSTRAGNAESISEFSLLGVKQSAYDFRGIIRGIFTPFIGINNSFVGTATYDIRKTNIDDETLFTIRCNNDSQYFAISDRYSIDDFDRFTEETGLDVENPIYSIDYYRGDCFTNTISIRMLTNFVDPDLPTNEIIIEPDTWKKGYWGYDKCGVSSEDNKDDYNENNVTVWDDINRGDINAAPLGHWITYKCLSNYNLGLRSEDYSNVEEMSIMGNPRTFYPKSDAVVTPSHKILESYKLNNGYNKVIGEQTHFALQDVPYIKDVFNTRIMFSNVQVDDNFKNAYRIFQGLSYKDIDSQYGAIVKLLPLGTNLFCVFEHGVGIIPINEKALMSTTSGQSIHMYGAGVIQNQISLVNPDFGSIWDESILRTPVGIYGVDTYGKKIWRYNANGGFETISDMKVQKFLNENITLSESDKTPIIGLKNVKTHYNNFKGDVMFTFYKDDTEWNLCYNERMQKWITKYSWTPICSENVNNIFFSLDNDKVKPLSLIYYNKLGMDASFNEESDNDSTGLRSENNEYTYKSEDSFKSQIKVLGYDYENYTFEIVKISTSEINNDVETSIDDLDINLITIEQGDETCECTINPELLKYHYLIIDVKIKCTTDNEEEINTVTFYDKLSFVSKSDGSADRDILLGNAFYVHGRAGIFDEIGYDSNAIEPTKWYGKQEKFEYEFVVNHATGVHKIFDNLAIVSNNVEPESFTFEIEGDVYEFNKEHIYKYENLNEDEFINSEKSQCFDSKVIIRGENEKKEYVNKTEVTYDSILNSYGLKSTQDCKNMSKLGRTVGNIQYKEGMWYSVIEPIFYKEKYKSDLSKEWLDRKWNSTRIRDKYLKIRVTYSGTKTVVITALRTLMTLSYA